MSDAHIDPADLARRVIRALGGPTKLSRLLVECGAKPIPVKTIHSWGKSKSGIPEWRRDSLISVAKKKDIGLPVDFFDEGSKTSEAA